MQKAQYFRRSAWVSFFTAFTTLAAQILICRIISAKLYNNYAFLVISLTMLGFALSGVLLAFNLTLMDKLHKKVHVLAWLFVGTLLISTVLFYRMPLSFAVNGPSRIAYALMFMHFVLMACLFVVPFIFSGLILGILLAHRQLPTKNIYCFDLVGSAAGALLVVGAIAFWGVEKSLLMVCALFIIGINVQFPLRSKLNSAGLAILLAALAVLYANAPAIFKLKFPDTMAWTIRSGSLDSEYIQWDPVARIEVSKIRSLGHMNFDLSMVGPDRDFSSRIRKYITQNNNSGTWAFDYDGNRSSLKGVEGTMYYAAYRATAVIHPKVLVIGIGGGMDMLTALYANAAQVTGVEINGATVNILKHVYKDYFRNWASDPRVGIVHDEGRHYLSRSREKYDIIQLTGVDTFAGTMSSANIFSENYLYTKEAMKLYFDKLTDKGIINIIRLEYPNPPREMLRMLVTAVEELREMGIEDPSRHIVIFANAWLNGVSMLIKKTPFTAVEIHNLEEWTATNPYFKIVSIPGLPMSMAGIYQEFLGLNDPGQEDVFVRRYPFNIEPVQDDRPFFFRYTRWRDLFDPRTVPVFETNIVLLLSLLALICAVCIQMPLRHLVRSGQPLAFKHRYVLLFSSLGIGFFFVEIAFMQKLGLFLGHPNYAICVVLSGLLLATGLGSLFAGETIRKLHNIGNVTLVLSLLIVGEGLFILPYLKHLIQLEVAVKGILAYGLLFPVGFLLGVYMPESIQRLKAIAPHYVPWAWGINGIFSVIAPILAVAVSVTFGIKFLLITAVPFYLIAGRYLSFPKEDL